jgi:hypothetical protein
VWLGDNGRGDVDLVAVNGRCPTMVIVMMTMVMMVMMMVEVVLVVVEVAALVLGGRAGCDTGRAYG